MKKPMMGWMRAQGQTAWTTVFGNPVVLRDLRAQMRGTKSYWFQGAYLLLLGVLAIAGYAMATGQTYGNFDNARHHVNIVDAQSQLSTMYYFIFGTIAALILLIAPALTAASIVGERQRLSFDLLVTTPLKASELLVGKLISSIAFLGLLLMLSLPAAALCVILGGATIGDVFRTYVQFAIDGTVLAAIGLFFSCAARTNLLAVIWSYAATGAMFALTMALYCTGQFWHGASPLNAIAALNPIIAINPNGSNSNLAQNFNGAVDFFGLHLPMLLVSAFFAFLAIRLLVTASTFRLGVYGARCASSLRRQVLFVTGLAGLLFGHTMLGVLNDLSNPATSSASVGYYGGQLVVFLICGFMAAGAFLPALFVPASREEDLPGALHQQIAGDASAFRVGKAFQPVHSGAFPFYLLWLLTFVGATVLVEGIQLGQNGAFRASIVGPLAEYLLAGTFYLAALGVLIWQIARFAGTAVKTISGARGLSFGILALITALPMMILALTNNQTQANTAMVSQFGFGFIFYPILVSSSADHMPSHGLLIAVTVASGLCLLYSLPFALLRKAMLSRSRALSSRTAVVAATSA